jgi:glycosyltransferase involved in cell wall biosynthesis
VNLYIALTEFARMKFIVGGLPAGRVVVKPNFVPRTPPVGTGDGGFALYVGRLSEEKGVPILLRAWARLAEELPLRVVGDGPLADTVMAAARQQPGLTYLGRQSPEQVLALMGRAKLLVVPSVCYENFPMVVAEAYAVGLPVVASDLGSLADLVSHGRTGRLFRAGNPASLLAEVEYLHEHPAELASLRQTARAEFEQKYAAERNHEMLLRIYQTALASPPPT